MLPPSSFIKKYAPVLKPFLEYDPMSEKEALIARQYVFISVNLEFISILTTTYYILYHYPTLCVCKQFILLK